jgi:hypothetical protein
LNVAVNENLILAPTIIFDKSTIQSLSAAEAQWLTHMFYSNITPVLFLEIMADLKKTPKDKRTPEQFVSGLAKKFSPLNSVVNVHHVDIWLNDLIAGNTPEMCGKAIVGGGQVVTDESGKKGIFYDEPPEQEAFRRWQKGDFEEFERLLAERWRASIDDIDLDAFAKDFRTSMARIDNPTLERVCVLADHICEGRGGNRRSSLLAMIASLQIPGHLRPIIFKRWKAKGGPAIETFAPFAAWCFRVNMIADFAIAYGLVKKPMEVKNRIDLQYLYYLPFCDVFTSHDVFHRTLAPYLVRTDQTFVLGDDLKRDLKKIDDRFAALPDDVKRKGRLNYAAYPPRDPELLTYQLWDKHEGVGWQVHAENPIEVTPEMNARIMEQLKPMIDAIERQGRKK